LPPWGLLLLESDARSFGIQRHKERHANAENLPHFTVAVG
jgi:hypothetical protein